MIAKMALIGLLLVTSISAAFAGDVYVDGYWRKNGSYVQPHYRSAPDSSYNNNWSVSPNVNPHTGAQGTLQPTWNDNPPSDAFGSFGTTGCPAFSLNC